ncbi:dTMP kinase [Streptomyces sp. ACA25]|uniref:dTMP kinase n=1 Tax=Streptomyces sp. ACA25 TaxID=3022596 RepID=UPI002307752B|nr:dTMP kinase [Streptomyces sp. ACA25]MDB1086537.1 dTMP kinase [Streptomyces sp. ACA25]
MTRAEQHEAVDPACDATDEALAADSRRRATRALLRVPALRRLWEAQFTGSIGDALAMLVLLLLAVQAALYVPPGGVPSDAVFGGGYRGAAVAVAVALAVRLAAGSLVGLLVLGPVAKLVAASGPLDRRWTMIGADGLRVAVLIAAPLWIDWVPGAAFLYVLLSVFLIGIAERLWTVARDSAAPALLPPPPPEGAAVRPLPDHHGALRRLWLRSTFVALPLAAAALVVVSLVNNLLATGIGWFGTHQAALGSYVAAGFFAASVSVLYFLELPDTDTPGPRSPLEGLRRPSAGTTPDKGRTGAVPVLVLGCAAPAAGIAAAAALAVLHTGDLFGGPVYFGLLVLALTGGVTAGIRWAHRVLPALSRRRLLALAVAATGLGLFGTGLISDPATVLLCAFATGLTAGIAARTGHVLLDQETEEFRRPRLTQHLHAVLRLVIPFAVIAAPLLAALIGPQRVERGDFAIDHGGAAYTLMIIGALLLPVAALLLRGTDDRRGVPLLKDLTAAVRDSRPAQATAASGFFIAVEGGDGAGKSTQVEALAEWIRSKGHEVVITREPGATAIGQRLRSILLDVSSAGLSHRAEALMYAADRAEHVDSVILPALKRGSVVISDRYVDSSVAYQGAGRDLAPTEIARISRWATDGLVPHLTVLLDVSPETARERFTEAPDRLESEPSEFHQRVRAGFLALAAADPARYLVIDAGQDPESVTTAARHRLDQVLPLSEAEVRAREEARRKAEEEARRKAEEERQRKEEEERRERERQEQLARLRAEEQERKRREAEEARRAEEARQAEEARKQAEEARRKAEAERRRREAEERLRREEEDRRRREAEEEARLRAQAEERRKEKQRKAEEALLRAEEARLAAEAAKKQAPPAAPAPPPASADPAPDTVRIPKVQDDRPKVSPNDETAVLPRAQVAPGPDDDETTVLPQVGGAGVSETAPLPQVSEEEVRRPRSRPEWAEETPLDDLPTLADELLGPRETDRSDADSGSDADSDEGRGGSGGARRR